MYNAADNELLELSRGQKKDWTKYCPFVDFFSFFSLSSWHVSGVPFCLTLHLFALSVWSGRTVITNAVCSQHTAHLWKQPVCTQADTTHTAKRSMTQTANRLQLQICYPVFSHLIYYWNRKKVRGNQHEVIQHGRKRSNIRGSELCVDQTATKQKSIKYKSSLSFIKVHIHNASTQMTSGLKMVLS